MKVLAPQGDAGLVGEFATPSGLGFIALLEAFRSTGGTAPGEIVERLLEEHRVGNALSLAKLIHTGQVFGFAWRTCLWIPMFQFDAYDLAPKSSAQRVRSALPRLWSGWTVASWFAAANARLDGHSPADSLDADLGAVVRAAQPMDAFEEGLFPRAPVATEVAAIA